MTYKLSKCSKLPSDCMAIIFCLINTAVYKYYIKAKMDVSRVKEESVNRNITKTFFAFFTIEGAQ